MQGKQNGKMCSGDEYSISPEILNPFVHHLELASTYDKIKTAVMTVVLLPLRLLAIVNLLVVAWLLACVGLAGLSDQDLRSRPLSGWRKKLTPLICALGKGTYQAGGMNIIVKGRQATRKEAPILVVAPHSTFLDASITYVTGFPSIIARRESGCNPFIGKLINYTQPVYVWRDDPNSRQNSIKEIIERVNSDQDWPQILIFPEGTCTNRSCLITFKQGAFYPGVPVQPVCIRYPNKLDTVTWTWEGPGALKLLWLTLTRVHSNCEIEFLPVYRPSEAEKKDPKLFANNVRQVMAKALGVPVSDYAYDDCRLMTKARQMNLPCASGLMEVQKLRHKLGLAQKNVEEHFLSQPMGELNSRDGQVSYEEFARLLGIPAEEEALHLLFKLYDKTSTGSIDFREYLLSALSISKANNSQEVLELAFKIFDSSGSGRLSVPNAMKALSYTLAVSQDDLQAMFKKANVSDRNYVTFDEFKKCAQQKEVLTVVTKDGKEKTS